MNLESFVAGFSASIVLAVGTFIWVPNADGNYAAAAATVCTLALAGIAAKWMYYLPICIREEGL
tara:strand:- start:223 stop:414 length:192 start_codon:yes stop_codon:yes gene_type:complete